MSIKPRVLLTNDDGPPGHESPYIYGLYRHLTQDLGWDVKVVIPSSQKSWIGKAYHIKDIIAGRYYYPQEPGMLSPRCTGSYPQFAACEDGLGEVSEESRPLKEGEVAEWILLDGTPATCANIGLHNLYHGEIDLLQISGPNLGRNSSAAFALSSGTIGAALSSALSKVRSVAISYGTVQHPTPPELYAPAHALGSRLIAHLWHNWGADAGGLRAGEVDLYNVNIPMVPGLLSDAGLTVCWTRIWRNSYGRLFKAHAPRDPEANSSDVSAAGPDSPDESPEGAKAGVLDKKATQKDLGALMFKWGPDVGGLINPAASSVPIGSDGWAIHKGWVSVTPMRATFGEPTDWTVESEADFEPKIWKMKL
ncbi:sure-like protein [Trametes meyenii]|nr:sure-like protein [Trametes meyenii]